MIVKTHLLASGIAGALGGALITVLILTSPHVQRFLLPQFAGPVTRGPAADSVVEPVLTQSESYVVAAVEKANPAVVSIVVTKDVPVVEQYFEETPNSRPNPFEDFFGINPFTPFQFQVPQYRQNGTEKREVGGGSGFLVSADGLIVTNRHVVSEDDVEYTVFMNDGTKFEATVLARDPVNDLAVLKIDASNLPYLELASSNTLKVGQSVIAIGNALAEFRNTVSVGVISGLSRSIVAGDSFGQSEQLDEVIQTDAAINLGNSGGPLLNLNGEVVGVNVAVAAGSENIGFALPIDIVRSVVKSVVETGKISRPYLGVRYVAITPALVEKNSLSIDYGVLVVRGADQSELAIIPGSPAHKAGIVEGDIILEIDGTRIDETHSLANQIRRKNIGDIVTLTVLHGDEQKTVQVTLEEFPD